MWLRCMHGPTTLGFRTPGFVLLQIQMLSRRLFNSGSTSYRLCWVSEWDKTTLTVVLNLQLNNCVIARCRILLSHCLETFTLWLQGTVVRLRHWPTHYQPLPFYSQAQQQPCTLSDPTHFPCPPLSASPELMYKHTESIFCALYRVWYYIKGICKAMYIFVEMISM